MRSGILFHPSRTQPARRVAAVPTTPRPEDPSCPIIRKSSRLEEIKQISPRSRAVLLMSSVPPSSEPSFGKIEDDGNDECKMIPAPVSTRAEPHFHAFHLKEIAHGCWYDMHLFAANGKRAALEEQLEVYSQRFVCVKCRLHIRDYVAKHPRPAPLDESALNRHARDAMALFRWTTEFHNSVTIRIYEETRDPARGRVLSETGVAGIFRELTIGADEDEANYNLKSECGGPASPCEGAAPSLPVNTVAAATVRWVPR